MIAHNFRQRARKARREPPAPLLQDRRRLADALCSAGCFAAGGGHTMPEQPDNPVAGEAEAQTAEAQTATAATAEAPPENPRAADESQSEAVVPVPVQLPVTAKRGGAESESATEAAEATTAPDTPAAPVARRAGSRIGALLYRLADKTLWALNRPFTWVGPEVRRLVGVLAIVSLGVSLLALCILPLLFPPRDAVSLLRQKSAQVQKHAPLNAEAAPH